MRRFAKRRSTLINDSVERRNLEAFPSESKHANQTQTHNLMTRSLALQMYVSNKSLKHSIRQAAGHKRTEISKLAAKYVGEVSDKVRAAKVLSVRLKMIILPYFFFHLIIINLDFNVGCAFMHLYAKNNADSDTSNVHLENENLSSWGDFSSFFLLYGGQPSFIFSFFKTC